MKTEPPLAKTGPPRCDDSRHLWQIAAARDILFGILAVALLWSIFQLREILLPVLLGLLLAQLFNPAITYLQHHWGWPRTLTIALIMISGLGSLAALSFWLGPLLYAQVVDLLGNLPRYLRALAEHYAIDLGALREPVDTALANAQADPRQILAQIFHTTGRAIGWATAVIGMATYFTLALILIPLYFFVFAWYFNAGLAKLEIYLPRRHKGEIVRVLGQMDRAVGDFFRGRLVIALIMGALLSAGWYSTGVPYWFALGMITGFLNIIPYFSTVGWPLAVLLKYVSDLGTGAAVDWVAVALWPSVVFVFVQLLEGWVLTPWIQSGQTNLSAVTIIIVVFVGAALAGLWGMLFAIPAAACVKILLAATVLPWLERWAARN